MGKVDKQVKKFQEHLSAGEYIVHFDDFPLVVTGLWERTGDDISESAGSLIATNQRLVFFFKSLGVLNIQTFPYTEISRIEHSKDLIWSQAKVITSGGSSTIKMVNEHKVLSKIVEFANLQVSQGSARAQSGNQEGANVPEQIKQLSELHQSGILTDEEFASKKQILLDRM